MSQKPANSIVHRVQEFLSGYPPFSLLPQAVVLQLAQQVSIQYFKKNERIFSEGEATHTAFYVLRQGALRLTNGDDLIDDCDDGDVFGIRSLFSASHYIGSATAREDSIVYAIPSEVFFPYLEQYPKVALFFAAGFASGNTVVRDEPSMPHQPSTSPFHLFGPASLQDLNQVKTTHRPPLTCAPQHSIQQAALQMAQRQVGSIIVVDEALCPLGIVTDKDLRNKVATGKVSIEVPIAQIMSSPVACILPNPTVNEVLMTFVKRRFHHLCCTEDGTPATRLLGVISDHDLMLEKGEHPATLMKQARRAADLPQLADLRNRLARLIEDYLDKGVAIDFVAEFTTAIDDAILDRLVEFALDETTQELGELPCSFCWLALGSQGREEQLLRTDQDNALIYETETPEAKAYFLRLAKHITDGLETVGFERCPAGMMASEPAWCMSLADWKATFDRWIKQSTPEAIMHLTIFFDFKAANGNAALAHSLREHIYASAPQHALFMSSLAKNALENPPPLSFFRSFMVEKDGAHKDQFDIKARAMMPLADAARLLTIFHTLPDLTNTAKRFEAIASLETEKTLFTEAAAGYHTLMRLRTTAGLRAQSSGRFLDPAQLSKLERQALKNIFNTIAEIQKIIKIRFRTQFLG